MEPMMYLVFVPIFIALYLIFSRLGGNVDMGSMVFAGIFTFISMGATTYYQAAKKNTEERTGWAHQTPAHTPKEMTKVPYMATNPAQINVKQDI